MRKIVLPTATKASYENLLNDARTNREILTRPSGAVEERWRHGTTEPMPQAIDRLWAANDIQIAHIIRAYEYAMALRIQMFRDEKDVVAVANHLVKLAEKIQKRDNEITKVLRLTKKWMRDYQPVLDEAKKDYERMERRIVKR